MKWTPVARRGRASALLALAFVLTGLAWGRASGPGAQQKPRPAKKIPAAAPRADDGRVTFEAVCASCHGLDGRGGERGPDIATRAVVVGLGDSETLRIIERGRTWAGMPGFASLGRPKVAAVLRHLRKLQGKEAPRGLPGKPAAGRALFFGKAQCSSCHMINGLGGFLGSDLSSYGSSHSVGETTEAIREPYKNLDPRLRVVVLTDASGRQWTGMARNEDNFSIQLQAEDGTFHFFDKRDAVKIEHQERSFMPADYGARLQSAEIDDLVSFLLSQSAESDTRVKEDE